MYKFYDDLPNNVLDEDGNNFEFLLLLHLFYYE